LATTNGATVLGHLPVGWGRSAATTVVRGGIAANVSLFAYSLSDYDALAAGEYRTVDLCRAGRRCDARRGTLAAAHARLN